MSFTPCLVWVTPGVRQQLIEYASLQNEMVERIGGDLVCEALRARNAPPATWVPPSTEPPAFDYPDDDELPEVAPADRTRTVAEQFLLDLLAGGRRSGSEVRTQAGGAGIPWHAVNVAAQRLGVHKRKGDGYNGAWWWTLPG
ncbi:hypothetical protein [Paraburkholderia pallida]|uniref:Uncharacterized protein n=1 Tax=Paraburkholderia pallida TaxID=2547399 RepID=A0A4P7CS12_9BURK|nr:hypothetical protein [Paraburkholderia pallida]QBQ97867.1 hypothetical protein E1956_12225 [Paraburkholderia pallida]